jgi:4-hydroxy-tetrahydrodipicolinate synthase
MRRIFQGSLVAMVTPFRDGQVDEAKLADLVEFHVASGTDGLVAWSRVGPRASRRPSATPSTRG